MRPDLSGMTDWALHRLTGPAQRRVLAWMQVRPRETREDATFESRHILDDEVDMIRFRKTRNLVMARIWTAGSWISDQRIGIRRVPEDMLTTIHGMDGSDVVDHETARGRQVLEIPMSVGGYTTMLVEETGRMPMDLSRYAGTSMSLENVHDRLMEVASRYDFDPMARHLLEIMEADEALAVLERIDDEARPISVGLPTGESLEMKRYKAGPTILARCHDLEREFDWYGPDLVPRSGQPLPIGAIAGGDMSQLTCHPALENLTIRSVTMRNGHTTIRPQAPKGPPSFGLPPAMRRHS